MRKRRRREYRKACPKFSHSSLRARYLWAGSRAVIDHFVRRQREADDEAEKRQRGDHSPTFLEAERNVVDLKFYKGRQPPRFLPKWQPMARLDDAYSHQDEDSEKATLHDVTYSPDALREAAAAEEERQRRSGGDGGHTSRAD